jgi:hypothetical protein
MQYTNQQLNWIYTYIGFNFYSTFDPEIKSVIIATQAVADGGTQPDDTLQQYVLGLITQLQNVDLQLLNVQTIDFVDASSAGSKVNPARGDFLLRKQGRALIKQLCIVFGLKGVRQDYYSAPKVKTFEDNGMSYFPEDDI